VIYDESNTRVSFEKRIASVMPGDPTVFDDRKACSRKEFQNKQKAFVNAVMDMSGQQSDRVKRLLKENTV
jgi:hypothetical protein